MYRLVLVWVCCALALGGCTKPEEGGTLPPLALASPSVSPSPSKSAGPVDDKAAIVALARDYFLERNIAARTGDTKRLRALATPICPCNNFANTVDEGWSKGRIDSPNYYTVIDARSPFFRNPNAGVVTVFYRTNRYVVLDRSGKVLLDIPPDATTQSFRVDINRVGGNWKVANVVGLK